MQFAELNGHIIHYKFLPGLTPVADPMTFMFINSLGTDFRIWNEVAAELRYYGNILLFDNRGHGLSDVVEDTNGINDYADDAIALLEDLSINKCIPIGLSVGGMIAQIMAIRIPQKIRKLVFCDTRHKIGNAQIWNDRIASVKKEGLPSISDGVMQRWFSEKFRNENPTRVSGYKIMLERTPPLGYIKACEAIRDADLTEIAKQIRIPSLCIAGSEDKSTTPEEVKNLADLIKGSKYEVIEGSGHIPCVDNSETLSKLIIDFIIPPVKTHII
jgi:3-oxoadipate enol-lactonase